MMPFIITKECIACAACETVCPHDGIRKDEDRSVYVIDAASCTECVGFFNDQQCAVVCPVACCIVDPNDNALTEAALFERAKAIHANSGKRPTLTAQTSHFRVQAAGKWWERLYQRVRSNTPAEDVTEELEVENSP